MSRLGWAPTTLQPQATAPASPASGSWAGRGRLHYRKQRRRQQRQGVSSGSGTVFPPRPEHSQWAACVGCAQWYLATCQAKPIACSVYSHCTMGLAKCFISAQALTSEGITRGAAHLRLIELGAAV
jgi:hypothetical protein